MEHIHKIRMLCDFLFFLLFFSMQGVYSTPILAQHMLRIVTLSVCVYIALACPSTHE
jgi:hypothetical protein